MLHFEVAIIVSMKSRDLGRYVNLVCSTGSLEELQSTNQMQSAMAASMRLKVLLSCATRR